MRISREGYDVGKLRGHENGSSYNPYRTLGEFLRAAELWVNFYNQERPHKSLAYRSPNQFATEHALPTVPYLPLS